MEFQRLAPNIINSSNQIEMQLESQPNQPQQNPQIFFSQGPKPSNNIPWVEKYRPHELNQLISHESILTTLKTFMKDSNIPNLLFYGPPGTGKTSTIVALAKELYQKDYNSMVLELNASDQRGIAVVRDQIKTFVGSGTLLRNNNLKLVILDEADMMTKVAQFALRRIIEKYHSNARFCLISNYVSKVIPALQSRCTRFKFKQISFDECQHRIFEIAENERLNISKDAVQAIFKLSQGDMRRVINMLQSLSLIQQSRQISADQVYEFTGNPSPVLLENILNSLFQKNFQECFEQLECTLKVNGIAIETVLKQIYQLLLMRDMPNEQKAFLVNRLGDLEYRMSIGSQQKVCLASLIGAFIEIRHIN